MVAEHHRFAQPHRFLGELHVRAPVSRVTRKPDIAKHPFLVAEMAKDVRNQFLEPRQNLGSRVLRSEEQGVGIVEQRAVLGVDDGVATLVGLLPLQRALGRRRLPRCGITVVVRNVHAAGPGRAIDCVTGVFSMAVPGLEPWETRCGVGRVTDRSGPVGIFRPSPTVAGVLLP